MQDRQDEKPASRLGDFEEERQKIVEEYARGSYLRTSADEAMSSEKKKGDADGNSE